MKMELGARFMNCLSSPGSWDWLLCSQERQVLGISMAAVEKIINDG